MNSTASKDSSRLFIRPTRLKLWVMRRARPSRSSGNRLRMSPCESFTNNLGRAPVHRSPDGGIGILGHQLARARVLCSAWRQLIVAENAADAFHIHRAGYLLDSGSPYR